jgi:hypothetical protein
VRFIRPFITATTALALTAAVAMAHQMPAASVDGLATAGAAAGKIVPVGHVTVDENGDQQDELTAEQTTEADQTDETNASEGHSHCIAPETGETTEDTDTEGTETEDTTATDESEPNHGAIVCGAAQAETPDGYANHGAYVREFAQDNNGAEKSAAAKTKHASGDVTTSNVTKHGKGHGHSR